MSFVFAEPARVSVPVVGRKEHFPVNRIYCVGRNYLDHVKEMGNDARGTPVFFQKPADAIVVDGRFPYPTESGNVHHELELVVALGPQAKIFGYAVGLDMTRRDLQAAAKKSGTPWEIAKAFDHSAPISAIVENSTAMKTGAMSLDVNGMQRQVCDVSDMIWNIEEIISELGRFFALKAGDLIYTGTPSGVGAVAKGDKMKATIEGVGTLDVEVV